MEQDSMPLVQKNVTVPQKTWDRLRRNAQASGAPLCVYLAHLVEQSHPVAIDDLKSQEALHRIEVERTQGRQKDHATS